MLLQCESLAVYVLHQRLSGLPTWSPRLHRRIALVRPRARRAIAFDWLPAHPRDSAVAAAALALQPVPARLRKRFVKWPPRYASPRFLGSTAINVDTLRQFNESYVNRAPFHIVSNNCITYADALSKFLVHNTS